MSNNKKEGFFDRLTRNISNELVAASREVDKAGKSMSRETERAIEDMKRGFGLFHTSARSSNPSTTAMVTATAVGATTGAVVVMANQSHSQSQTVQAQAVQQPVYMAQPVQPMTVVIMQPQQQQQHPQTIVMASSVPMSTATTIGMTMAASCTATAPPPAYTPLDPVEAEIQRQTELRFQQELARKQKEAEEMMMFDLDWHVCHTCGVVFYAGAARACSNPKCMAGRHSHSPIKTTYALISSPNYAYAKQLGTHSENWLWCRKCSRLFIDIDSSLDGKCGTCLDGQPHDAGMFVTDAKTGKLVRNTNVVTFAIAGQKIADNYEEGFVWCCKCSCLVRRATAQARDAGCSKDGGPHDLSKASRVYSLRIAPEAQNTTQGAYPDITRAIAEAKAKEEADRLLAARLEKERQDTLAAQARLKQMEREAAEKQKAFALQQQQMMAQMTTSESEVYEPGWHACRNCAIVFYSGLKRSPQSKNRGAFSTSLCVATQQPHDIMQMKGNDLSLLKSTHAELGQRLGSHIDGWLYCTQCSGLFIDVDAQQDGKCGICVCSVDGKGPHDAGIPVSKTTSASSSSTSSTSSKAAASFMLPFAVPPNSSSYRTGFLWCFKCSCLVDQRLSQYAKRACPATGGEHDLSRGTKTYSLYMDSPARENAERCARQDVEVGWRECTTCRSLVYAGTKRAVSTNQHGACCGTTSSAEGSTGCGDHTYAQPGFDLMPLVGEVKRDNVSKGWRWCVQCGMMFIDVDLKPDGKCGVCPAAPTKGGPHDAKTGPKFSLEDGKREASHQGDFVWCYKCSGLFNKQKEQTSRCPAGNQHSSARAKHTYSLQFFFV